MRNLLVAQSGGPTVAINATLAGVVERALTSDKIDRIYGGIYGIKGILEGNLREIGAELASTQALDVLANTPSSALGSCRYKLKDDDSSYERIIEVCREYDIGYFVYIGGNDSMDTVYKLSEYCKKNGIEDIKIMGAPKTVDNDLCATDHTPGFGSAAKYIATTISELFCDIRSYDMPTVTIVEIMGRNAGWLTASACLAGINGGDSPNLIYLPEVPYNENCFLADVKDELRKSPYVMVVVSEGLKNEEGKYLCNLGGDGKADAFGHIALSGTANYLAELVRKNVDCRVRPIELSLMQRCAAHIASRTDITEARLLGGTALERALAGKSGEMSTIKRISSHPYRIMIETTDIQNVANREKLVPMEWINARRNHVTQEMFNYLLPLIQGESAVVYKNGIPEHIRLF